MSNKLTLQETTLILLKNGYPLEIIPGKTQKSVRHHLLVITGKLPDFYIVFGDEAHGSLLDSAWITGSLGEKIRIKEEDLRATIEQPMETARWTREMPAAPETIHIPFTVNNSDLAHVQTRGIFVGSGEAGPLVKILGSDIVVELEMDATIPSDRPVYFKGSYRFPDRIESAELI